MSPCNPKLADQSDMSGNRPLRRLVKMPGVRDLESRLLLDTVGGGPPSGDFEFQRDYVLRKLFGITRNDTVFKTPDAYVDRELSRDEEWDLEDLQEEWELQLLAERLEWDEQRVEYLKLLGWDLADDDGKPLRITRYVCRVIEAATKGIAGTVPDAEVIARDAWAAQIQKDAAQFTSKSRMRR